MATKKKTAKKTATTKKKVAKTKPKTKPKCACSTGFKVCLPPNMSQFDMTASGRMVDKNAKVIDYLVIDDSGTSQRLVLRGKDLELDEANLYAENILETADFRIKEVNGLQSLIATIFGATMHDLDDDYQL